MRAAIHSSLVSTIFASSALVRMVLGRYAPQPMTCERMDCHVLRTPPESGLMSARSASIFAITSALAMSMAISSALANPTRISSAMALYHDPVKAEKNAAIGRTRIKLAAKRVQRAASNHSAKPAEEGARQGDAQKGPPPAWRYLRPSSARRCP